MNGLSGEDWQRLMCAQDAARRAREAVGAPWPLSTAQARRLAQAWAKCASAMEAADALEAQLAQKSEERAPECDACRKNASVGKCNECGDRLLCDDPDCHTISCRNGD